MHLCRSARRDGRVRVRLLQESSRGILEKIMFCCKGSPAGEDASFRNLQSCPAWHALTSSREEKRKSCINGWCRTGSQEHSFGLPSGARQLYPST